MDGTTIDTNVLLDVFFDDPAFRPASERALHLASLSGALFVAPATFAELVTAFARVGPTTSAGSRARETLLTVGIVVSEPTADEMVTAGLAFEKHLGARDPALVDCPSCGTRQAFSCGKCKRRIAWRAHILTDFLIGSHARHTTGRILTRDPSLHRKIEGLTVVAVTPGKK